MDNEKYDFHQDGFLKVQILGAGPAGLTAAKLLADRDVDTEIHEATSQVGGLSKTLERNGFRFDIGGHRFFTKSEWVQQQWQSILGGDLIKVNRISRIYFNGSFIKYPIQPLDAMKGLGLSRSLFTALSY